MPFLFRCKLFPSAAGIVFVLATTAHAGAQERVALVQGWTMAVETTPNALPADGWREVTVPSTFEDHLGAGFDGVCWYRRSLRGPDGGATRTRLCVHGAATDTTVFLDGEKLGSHLGAWTTFVIDLPLKPGRQSTLELRVDEKVGHNTQGFLPVIQPHFGGLWRSVELETAHAPTLARDDFFAFGELSGDTPSVRVETGVRPGPMERPVQVTLSVRDGARIVAQQSSTITARDAEVAPIRFDIPVTGGVRPWSPDRPNLYRVQCTLSDPTSGEVLDEHVARIGFRHVEGQGTKLLWNGRPLQLRGVLHWGYSAPRFAPPEDPEYWRPQLEGIKALGCNMVKACLWMPPPAFYEIADEIGLVVWQEYPTWHPTLTASFLPQLQQEYEELHRHDRGHVAVAIRSLTCETGHSAEIDVIRALFDRCKAMVPDTLLVDDSAWISWHRIHDFWDDHPYGNNSWWPGKLAEMKQYVAEHGAKPLLFGECIAADTWLDFDAWSGAHVADDAWWAPWGLAPQRAFADFVEREYGRAERDRLLPDSRDYALRNRKYQIERLRMAIPDAGYTISVVRDFTKARMGLWDDLGEAKWDEAAWNFQRDTLLGLDVPDDRRALPPGGQTLPIRIAHYGRGDLHGDLTVRVQELGLELSRAGLEVAEGSVSDAIPFAVEVPAVASPRRVHVDVELRGTHPARNAWDLWIVPPPTGTLPEDLRIVDQLDVATLDYLEQGGHVLLRAGDRKHCLRTEGLWFLKGAPIAPRHAIHERVPPEMLRELQSFDLERGEAMVGDQLVAEVDPVLLFWDTHDSAELHRWLLAFTTRVGKGRLAATTLAAQSPAGRYVLESLAACLSGGPEPVHALSDTTLARLRGELTMSLIDLRDFEIAIDPDDVGQKRGWQTGDGMGASWKPIRAGAHWESQGFEHYDGVAWYRIDVDVPSDWAGRKVTAVFEGVDDSYQLWLDGRFLGKHGDPATGETVWLVRTTIDLTPALQPGHRQRLVLRIVDHVGAGGINKPCYLTTGPVDPRGDLLR